MSSKVASEAIFILLLTLGVVFLISLITYTSSEDPWTGGAKLAKPVANSAGIFGAYVSDISLGILGYVSYVIPIAIGMTYETYPSIPRLMSLT